MTVNIRIHIIFIYFNNNHKINVINKLNNCILYKQRLVAHILNIIFTQTVNNNN